MKVIKVTKEYFQIEDEKVYFFEPLEKEISVDDMQKIADANEKLVKELKADWVEADDLKKLQTRLDNLKFDMEPKWKAHLNLEKCNKCGRSFYHRNKGV